jgi:rod shape-determining protein MreB
MFGRTPDTISAIRPMKDGVIADFEVTRLMITSFLNRVYKKARVLRPRIVIGVPSGITAVEKRAVIDSAEQAGARKVMLIEEPMAAAIGAGLPIEESVGSMVVDIGGGTTEVAVISLSAVAYSESLRVAGDEMDDALISFFRRERGLIIGPYEAERIKIETGSAYPLENELKTEVRGKDVISGIPRTMEVNSVEIRHALREPVNAIVETVRRALERCPVDLAPDILEKGLMLAGGGALLRGLDRLIQEKTQLKVYKAEDPLSSVVMGAGKVLDEFKLLSKVCIN